MISDVCKTSFVHGVRILTDIFLMAEELLTSAYGKKKCCIIWDFGFSINKGSACWFSHMTVQSHHYKNQIFYEEKILFYFRLRKKREFLPPLNMKIIP